MNYDLNEGIIHHFRFSFSFLSLSFFSVSLCAPLQARQLLLLLSPRLIAAVTPQRRNAAAASFAIPQDGPSPVLYIILMLN